MPKRLQAGLIPLIVVILVCLVVAKPWEKFRNAIAAGPAPVTQTFRSTSDLSTGIIRNINSTWPPPSTGNLVVGEATDGNSIVTYLASGSYFVHRGYVSFDTSSIPSDANIVSASIDLHISETAFGNDDVTTIEVVGATQGSTLTVEDYENIGSVRFASSPLASLSRNSFNTLPLNSNGLGAINRGGITQLGLRIGLDLQGVAPSGVNQFFTALNNSETVGIRLNVTYELPNNPPAAVAGTSLGANARLQLDGSLSSDSDGTITNYSWQIDGETSPRVGQIVSIADLRRGVYTVTLTVTDDKGVISSDTMLLGIR